MASCVTSLVCLKPISELKRCHVLHMPKVPCSLLQKSVTFWVCNCVAYRVACASSSEMWHVCLRLCLCFYHRFINPSRASHMCSKCASTAGLSCVRSIYLVNLSICVCSARAHASRSVIGSMESWLASWNAVQSTILACPIFWMVYTVGSSISIILWLIQFREPVFGAVMGMWVP